MAEFDIKEWFKSNVFVAICEVEDAYDDVVEETEDFKYVKGEIDFLKERYPFVKKMYEELEDEDDEE